MKKIAVFASGEGSNARRMVDYFLKKSPVFFEENNFQVPKAGIALIVCNNPNAGVLSVAAEKNIPFLVINKERFFSGDGYLTELKERGIDLIVLAGFLWKVPGALIKAYPERIINIHPALLPKYGGKGMYGRRVHQAVIDNKEKESGISIHYVDEQYDNGDIIFQATCPVTEHDTADSLAKKVQMLEHDHYPVVVEKMVDQLIG